MIFIICWCMMDVTVVYCFSFIWPSEQDFYYIGECYILTLLLYARIDLVFIQKKFLLD
jgi:hypothetical protein